MVFSSPLFLILFFPIVFSIYYLLSINTKQFKASNFFILVSSLIFYTWGEVYLVFVMLTSTCLDYYCARHIEKSDEITKRKMLLTLSIVGNLALLFYFKYYNFAVSNINIFGESFGVSIALKDIALPLGISFYTFQSMGYTIDVYFKRTAACNSFLNFACYVTMFPQLVAGPIVRYADVAKQLTFRVVSRENFSSGCIRFLRGLAKKVLIANTLAIPVDHIFGLENTQLTPSLAWMGAICYTLQIYYDFSGYSDMAIGLGQMMGFKFPENFNYPYQAKSIRDFWHRWHISLSTWFRLNLYIPLGGNRISKFRTHLNLLMVFFLVGLWHGASWPFVIWGCFHGMFLVIERVKYTEELLSRTPTVIKHLYVLLVVVAGWILFRANDLDQAVNFYKFMFGFGENDSMPVYDAAFLLTKELFFTIIVGIIFSVNVKKFISLESSNKLLFKNIEVYSICALGALSVISISGGVYNPFIYFRF